MLLRQAQRLQDRGPEFAAGEKNERTHDGSTWGYIFTCYQWLKSEATKKHAFYNWV